MPTPIAIETKQVRLRQWCPDDYGPFAQLNADPEVMRYFPRPLTKVESDAMASRCQQLIAQQGWGFWAVELKQDACFIGFVGLHRPAAPLPFAPCVEVGWRLNRHYWGQGLATEAARAALRIGFERLHLLEIVSFATQSNTRSQAVMRRLGMVPEPAGFDHPNLAESSALRPHCLFRLTRGRWAGQQTLRHAGRANVPAASFARACPVMRHS